MSTVSSATRRPTTWGSTTTTTTTTLTTPARRRPPSTTYWKILQPFSTTTNTANSTNTASTATTTTHAHFKPWNTPCVTSHGDYTQEAWLETHIGGPLYQHQATLPRLPVPTIDDTLAKFIPTALPLAESEQERQGLLDSVHRFASQAASLQTSLLERASQNSHSSWLQHWWNTGGYLQVRDTVVINVSYFFDFANDPAAPTAVTRGAAMLAAAAEFRIKICSGQQPAETVGKKQTPICSTAYKYLFHACRIPQLEQDAYRIYDPALHHHALVARKGHFFRIDFCNATTGEPHSLAELERALQSIVEQADQLQGANLPKLGWLTTQNRDDWAKSRQALLEYGGSAMEQALRELESGAVLLCLDDEAPVSRQESSTLYLHGDATSGANRWFDKSVQIIVGENGRAGFLGEHSMMDGMPVVTLANHLTQRTYGQLQQQQQEQQRQYQTNHSTGGQPERAVNVRPIFGPDLYPAIQQAASLVEKAQQSHLDWTGKHELNVQTFHGYGSTFMKQSGFSPDAFVQMAMQVATARLWEGKQAGTYEATQVRPFLHGRTETTRTVSTESAALVQALQARPQMDEHDPDQVRRKMDLLQKAAAAHVKYISQAAQAQGVDRHFFGLSMIAAEEGGALPDLYQDPVFARSKRWRVSTSHLTHPKFENWGYGEVVPDGVGLSYSIHPRHCVFNVTALKEHEWSGKLCELLQESLLELRRLIEANEALSVTTPKSKL